MQQQTRQVLEQAVLESNNNVYCFKATFHLMDKNERSLIVVGMRTVECICSHFRYSR